MPALRGFLTNLAKNPAAMKAFQADPKAAMQHAGLSANDQALITAKDGAALVNRLKGSGAAESPTVVVVVV